MSGPYAADEFAGLSQLCLNRLLGAELSAPKEHVQKMPILPQRHPRECGARQFLRTLLRGNGGLNLRAVASAATFNFFHRLKRGGCRPLEAMPYEQAREFFIPLPLHLCKGGLAF